MTLYRKKPVVIEARQLTASNFLAIMKWVDGEGGKTGEWCWDSGEVPPPFRERYITIETLEGNHKALEGDYIIKGVKGEFYPCKPDIFEMTYEVAE